jgi:hypothetical protein
MRHLPRDAQGRPIPWFAWWDRKGSPHVTIIDREKRWMSINLRLCQICGQPLGVHASFVLGPIQVETRTTTEGPAHPGCAGYALQVCPFLSNPSRERRDIKSWNPGVFALWTTRNYEPAVKPDGKIAVIVGDPASVRWWAARRLATAHEIASAQRSARETLTQTPIAADDAFQ